MQHAPDGLVCDVVTTAPHEARLRPVVEARGGRLVVVPTTVREPSAPWLATALRELAPDLVQVNLVDPTSMTAALEASAEVAPTVATLHMRGEEPDARTRAAYARLRTVVAVSRAFAAVAGSFGVEAVHVLNGVDPLAPVDPPGTRTVGALGRLTRQKGFDVLVEAVRLRGFTLLLGGEGREEAALRVQAAGLPVELTGFQEDPRAFFARVDVFALPSRVEALPLVLVEAVSAGLPAVATDVGDVREALGDVAVVVPVEDPQALADGIAALLDDPGDRRERGIATARAHLTAERMSRQAWEAFLR